MEHVERIEDILFRLDNATKSSDMNWPGWNLHPLKGEYNGFHAVEYRARTAYAQDYHLYFSLEFSTRDFLPDK